MSTFFYHDISKKIKFNEDTNICTDWFFQSAINKNCCFDSLNEVFIQFYSYERWMKPTKLFRTMSSTWTGNLKYFFCERYYFVYIYANYKHVYHHYFHGLFFSVRWSNTSNMLVIETKDRIRLSAKKSMSLMQPTFK